MAANTKTPVKSTPRGAAAERRLRAETQSRRRWVLNLPLLAWTALGLATVPPAGYFWHRHQVLGNAKALLHRSEKLEAEKDLAGATKALFSYLSLRPDDANARIRVAQVWHEQAVSLQQKRRAIQLHARAIALVPDDQPELKTELRRQHMSLVLETGDPQEAKRLAEKLLAEKQGPESDADAWRVKALAMLQQWHALSTGSLDEVAKALQTAFEADPSSIAVAAGLAQLGRDELRTPDADERCRNADEIMDAMVEASTQKDTAYLARSRYRQLYDLPGADDDLQRALAADAEGKNLDLLLVAAARELDNENWAAAEKHFERLTEVAPQEAKGYLGLGIAHERQEDPERALQTWKQGVKRTGDTQLLLQDRIVSAFIGLKDYTGAKSALADYERRAKILPASEAPAARLRVALFKADLALAQRQFAVAAPLWQHVISLEMPGAQSKEKAERVAQCYLRLGQCFEQLNELDQAAAAFQQAADRLVDQAETQFIAARAWGNAGMYDQALRMFHLGLDLDRTAKAPWDAYLEAIFRQQISQRTAERDWSEFENALVSAKRLRPDAIVPRVLEADYEAQRGRTETAVSLLRGIEDDALRSEGLAQRFVLSYERWGRGGEADRLADELRKRQPDALATLVMDLDLAYARGDFETARRRASSALPELSAADRQAAVAHLAQLDIGYGNLPEARAALRELTEADDVAPRLLHARLELALLAGDKPEADALIERLHKLRGDNGTFWRYYRAQRLLQDAAAAADKARKSMLAEVETLQAEIDERRPNWSAAKLLKARLHLLGEQPNEEAAIDSYRRAIDLGERRLQVYEELVMLLCRKGRLAEANHYLDRLRDAERLSPTFAALAMTLDASQGNLGRAVAQARKECERDPDSSLPHLHLGNLLALDRSGGPAALSARLSEAEAELKRAREISPDEIGAWSGLAQFYLQEDRRDEARQLMTELALTKTAAKPEGLLLLAQAHLHLGDREQAEAYFEKSLKAAPDDGKICVEVARFYLPSDVDRARRLLEHANKLDPNDRTARFMLADLLAVSTYGDTEKNMDFVTTLLENSETDETSRLTRRLKAIVNLRRGGSKLRQEAQQLLESINASKEGAAPLDRLLLARIYEAQGQAVLARQELEALVKADKPRPEHLATYLEFLLRARAKAARPAEIEREAEQILTVLAAVEPEEKYGRTASLRVRWLKAQGRENEIEGVVARFVGANQNQPTPVEQSQILLSAANLYSSVELNEPAETCYRQALELNSAVFAPFAAWLTRTGRPHEAVDLCVRESARQLLPAAKTLVAVLIERRVPDDDRRSAEAVIQLALERHGDDIQLLCGISSLMLVEDNEAEAVRLLRRALEIQPRHLQALNNLAVLLSEKPASRDQALEYVDRAIALAGLTPELADTKGWVLLMRNQPAEAEAMFQEAIAGNPSHKRYFFHQSLALHALGDLPNAREKLESAKLEELAGEVFTVEERSRLDRLNSALH